MTESSRLEFLGSGLEVCLRADEHIKICAECSDPAKEWLCPVGDALYTDFLQAAARLKLLIGDDDDGQDAVV